MANGCNKNMTFLNKVIKPSVIVLLVLVVVVFIIFHYSYTELLVVNHATTSTTTSEGLCRNTYSQWPPFDVTELNPSKSYRSFSCFPLETNQINADTLATVFQHVSKTRTTICRQIFMIFSRIYRISVRYGDVALPDAFVPRVKQWLGGSDVLLKEVYHQDVHHIMNQYTYDHTIYNPIRGKRPIAKPDVDQREHLLRLVNDTKDTCDFCNYKQMTAEDTFGRLETELSFSAANTFKYDGWHSMFNMKIHNPLEMTEEGVMDIFALGMKWCNIVHKLDPSQRFVHMVWDMTLRGGGSQLHPHMHASIDNQSYYGQMELLRAASERYYKDHGGSYFQQLAQLHVALGYGVRLGDALAIAPITPKKDYEMMILSKEVNRDVYRLLYRIIRVYFDELNVFSFSFSMILPELGDDTQAACGRMPVVARIVPRGDLTNPRQDVSSLEMFTVYNVNDNPHRVPELLRKRYSL